MAGADNLKGHGFDEITAEEQRAIASKGGKASVQARRRKKAMKTVLREMLAEAAQGKAKEKAEAMGASGDEADNQAAILAAMIDKAQKGNVQAAQFIATLTGEDPYADARTKEVKARQGELKLKQLEYAREEAEAQTDHAADITAVWESRKEATGGEPDGEAGSA